MAEAPLVPPATARWPFAALLAIANTALLLFNVVLIQSLWDHPDFWAFVFFLAAFMPIATLVAMAIGSTAALALPCPATTTKRRRLATALALPFLLLCLSGAAGYAAIQCTPHHHGTTC